MLTDFKQYLRILSECLVGEELYLFVGIILGIIYKLCTLASPFLTRSLVDTVIGQKNYALLIQLLFLCLIILIILVISNLVSNYLLIKALCKGTVKLKTRLFEKLLNISLEFFRETPSGAICFRLLRDTDIIATSWNEFLVTIPLQSVLLLGGIFMAFWHANLALFAIFLIGLQIFVIAKFRNPLLRYAQFQKSKDQEVNAYTVETFQKIQLIHSLNTEKKEQINFHKKLHDLVKVFIRYFMLNKFSNLITLFINNIWMFGILGYGGSEVIAGKMTLGTLMAFLLLANILYQPILSITNFILSFQDIRASLRRYLEYFNLQSKILEVPNAIEFVPSKGRIILKDISFGYDSRLILRSVNLEIPPNIIFALVGKSGAGKTTLCRLLVRFYDPIQGVILLDGKDIRRLTLSSLRKSIFFMLQNDYVFSGTLWENITYGLKSVTKDDVYRACKEAALDFAELLPNGYETKIGQDGINLSVGEAQRIALARAFLIKPKVLILDEPTAFIDVETENKIKNSLIKLKESTTIILIAHRLSTVMIADKIGVMQNGQVVEVGTHRQLLEKDGVYRKIYGSILGK